MEISEIEFKDLGNVVIENTSKKYYNGSKWLSKNSGGFEVIAKTNRETYKRNRNNEFNHYLIKFMDDTIIEVSNIEIKSGNIKNPNQPNVYNIGYFGI